MSAGRRSTIVEHLAQLVVARVAGADDVALEARLELEDICDGHGA